MILVTGASGFIGQNIIKKLSIFYPYEEVICLTSKPLSGVKYMLHENYNFSLETKKQIQQLKITAVIHAGAFTPKNGAEANLVEQSNSNINYTHQLIDLLPNTLTQFIFLSTLDVYANIGNQIIDEQTPIQPISLYGQSKWYCEKLLQEWGKIKQCNVQILRIGHVYGPGEEAYQKIIPITIQKLLRNEVLEIWGNGTELRSFIYVEDVAELVVRALNLITNYPAINLVSDRAISIANLLELINNISGKKAAIQYLPSKTQSRDLVFNNELMKTILGLEKTSLEEGLLKEWDYFSRKYKC
jgi:UDP-glucose 4-epimerase